MTDTKATIAVIDLGYVGLPLTAEFSKHCAIIGFGIQADRITELRGEQGRTRELDAAELVELHTFLDRAISGHYLKGKI